MQVVLLGPYPPPHGGIQAHLVALRQFLEQNEITCSVINITSTRRPSADGVHYPRGALEAARLLIRHRHGIVHLHVGGDLTGRLLALGLFCCVLPGGKAVLTLHSGGYPSSTGGRTARKATVRGFVLRRFQRVIGVNQEIAQLFQRLGVAPARTQVISPFGVTSGQARRQRDTEAIEPAALAAFIRSHQPVLLTVGLLEPEYDLPLQIDAVGSLLEQHPRLGLIIIGSGRLERELRQLVDEKPYADHVHLAGDVSHDVALRAIAASDVLLRTTWYDGDSIAIREALQTGTPVVATDNGMRPDGVRLIAARQPAALREAIASCLADATPRPRRVIAADEGNLMQVLQVYKELMA